MMMEESRDIDDVLTLKLSIEPTEATRQSLNELSGLTDQILDTIVKTSQAFDSTLKQREQLYSTINAIDADGSARDAQEELKRARETAEQSLREVSTPSSRVTPLETLQAVTEDSRGVQTQFVQQAFDFDPGITKQDAMDRASTYESLVARGLDTDFNEVGFIAESGGITEFLKDTLQKENGSVVDQLSVVASRLGQATKDVISGNTEKSITPKFLETLNSLPEEALENLVNSVIETAESTKKLADKVDKEELEESGVAPKPEEPKTKTEVSEPEEAPRPRPEKKERPTPPPPTPEEKRLTAAQEIEQLFGVSRGRNGTPTGVLMSRANKISQWGDRITAIGENLSPDVEYDENGDIVSTALHGGALMRSGSRIAGATGLGQVGSKVSQIGSSVAGVASKLAVPVAIGAAAYTMANKGTDYFYDTAQSGYAEGETGLSAFTTGLGNRMSDTLGGWNPFTPEGTKELTAFRNNALNTGLGITSDDERFQQLMDAQIYSTRRGLRADTALRMFGSEIMRNEDFDVEKALDELAEGAREAKTSLQDFAEMSVGVAEQLESRFALSDSEVTGEISSLLNSGVFDPETGIFGGLDTREKQGFVSRLQNYDSSEAMNLFSLVGQDDNIMQRLEQDGIDYRDRDQVLEWIWSGNLSAEELNNLIVGVATRNLDPRMNQTSQREAIKNATGIAVPSGRLDLIPEYDGIAEQRNSLGNGLLAGTNYGTASTTVTIRLSDGLVADVASEQETSAVTRGEISYEDRQQSGRLGTVSTNPNGYSNSYYGG